MAACRTLPRMAPHKYSAGPVNGFPISCRLQVRRMNMFPSTHSNQKSQWSKIYDLLASPQSLAAVGVIATGALLWYNKDALVTNGVKLGAKAVANIGTKMFSPTTAANFVLDKFA